MQLKPLSDRLQVAVSPVFELLAMMFRVHAHEHLLKHHTRDISRQPLELNHWVERKRSMIPEDVRNELAVFFDFESYFGLTLIWFAWKHQVHDSIDSLMEKLQDTPSQEWFPFLLQTGYFEHKDIDDNDPAQVHALIENSNLPEAEKWKATYLFIHADQTKQRLIQLLKDFHPYVADDLYQYIQLQEGHVQLLKNYIEEHGEDALIKVFETMLQMEPKGTGLLKLVLAPTASFYDIHSYSELDDCILLVYGTKKFEACTTLTMDKAQILSAFKILADEKRLEIIRLLQQGPLYGYELAQRLHLSNSTVSHHLSSLVSLGIIEAVRKENRIYYEHRADQIEKLMEQMRIALIGT
ncbi:ArsR/SmtB family transcription factor [Paenibacillus sp. 1001270B_150601_E10]|uniref:ArsR/SmtB family transcription factor n=1 Tax=Paenibacillus sp. 1001270B_150601_E10 TaxID=2787079 RepID=UPI00189E1677|nr:metalloregulator ArsR/SmtB family transcription factor [Paenibacillus sp. 1001270B_150601_E10]